MANPRIPARRGHKHKSGELIGTVAATTEGNWVFEDDKILYFGTDEDVGLVYDAAGDARGEFIGDWTFISNTGFNVEGSGPRWASFENNASADEGGWAWYANGGVLSLRLTSDANHPSVTASGQAINVRRSGTTPSSVDFECPVVIDYASAANTKLSIGDGTEADGRVLLRLSLDRAWEFRQGSTGASTRLDLYSTTNKTLRIGGDSNGVLCDFNTGSTELQFPDNAAIAFGSSQDYKLYYDSNSLDFVPASSGDQVNFLNGSEVRAWDSSDTYHCEIRHNGTNAIIDSLSTGITLYNGARGYQNVQVSSNVADDGTTTFSLTGDGGFVFIVAQTTSACETGQSGAFFYFSGTTMIDIGTGANWSLGSGSNPNIDTDHNVWRSADSVISVKNRRGSSRYYSLYCLGGI